MDRVLLGPAAHLGRDEHVELGTGAQVLADQLLAAAVTVHVGGVEERHAGLRRAVEHRDRVLVRHVAPVGAELPGAEPHDRDLASRATQCAYVHLAAPRGWGTSAYGPLRPLIHTVE